MRILWVKGGKLFPIDTGGKIRTYNILKNLARENRVTFISYYPGERDAAYERELQEQFPGAIGIPIHEGRGRLGALLHYGVRVPHPAPYSVTKYTDRAVYDAVLAQLNSGNIDVAVCDFLLVSLNFPEHAPVPMALFQHNVESALWRRQADVEAQPIKRAFFQMEAWKMRRYESRRIGNFDWVVAVSDIDRAQMLEMNPKARIGVVRTGVDVKHFEPGSTPRSAHNVVFLGSMDWPPNVDGVEYLCEEIWPSVLAKHPSAKFRVVGRRPPPRIQRLASASVEIIGGVDDVRPYLHDAAVFVVPLRIGGGTRLKIYEAMAAGVPIVSTTIGAEGLDVTNDRDILIRDAAADFADGIAELLNNPKRRADVASAALQTVQGFDWPAVAKDFERQLAALTPAPARPSR